MATLLELLAGKSLSEISEEEAQELILATRKSRRSAGLEGTKKRKAVPKKVEEQASLLALSERIAQALKGKTND